MKHGSAHEDRGKAVVAVSLVSATVFLEPETQVRPGVEIRAAVGALAAGISRRGVALRRARAQGFAARAGPAPALVAARRAAHSVPVLRGHQTGIAGLARRLHVPEPCTGADV